MSGAPEPLQRDTQTKALIQTELDLKSVTLTLGSVTVSDAAGIRTISLGATNGTKIGATGNKMGFLGATPVVRPTGNAFTALVNLGLIVSPSLTTTNITGLDAALAARQPLDSDLTSIAALATTSFGRDFNTLADAASARTKIGTVIGTDVQAFDSDLASIAALATTSYGRDFNTVADAAAARTKIGAGTISIQDASNVTVGTLAASGNATITGNTSGSTFSYSGNGTVVGTLEVTGASTLAAVNATSGAFSTTLGVTGNTTLGGTLGVTGATSGSSFSYSGNGTVGGTFSATGNSTLGGTLGITGPLSGSSFSFSGNGSVTGTLGVTGAFSGTTGTFSSALASGPFSATTGTFSSTLGVTGAFTGTSGAFSTTLGVTGNTTLDGTLSVGGHTNVNGNRVKNVGAEAIKLVDFLPDNAVHNASVNYTSQLNAAIAAAAAGTRRVELPEWPVSIDATITVNSPVLIVGKGGYGPVNTAADASRLVWAGGAGGTMMKFTAQANAGGGLEFVTLDGNGIAGTCLVVEESSYGHYDHSFFVNYTTGDGIKVTGGTFTASWNTFTRPYVDGGSGNGNSGIYMTGVPGTCGNSCLNVFISPQVFHGGNRPAWLLGMSDNNTIIAPFNQRTELGTGAGFQVDPNETPVGEPCDYGAFSFPAGYRIYHSQAGYGGWVQPANTGSVTAFIEGYHQDNGAPDPVLNGTRMYWSDENGDLFVGQVNGATITKGVGGASIDLGLNVLADKFDLYHSGTTRFGMGIATSEMRMFVPTGAHISYGGMSTGDGTTFTEGARMYSDGGLNIGGATNPGPGNIALTGTVTSSTALTARAYNGADISLPDNTATVVTLNSERWDSNSIHSTSSNTGRLTCNTAGTYTIAGTVAFDINSTGFRFIAIRLNGATYLAIQKSPAVTGNYTEISVSQIWNMVATDYVELIAFQNSGGAINIKSFAASSPEFSMVRVP